jgi:class 3 adenylate cyclase
VEPRIQFAKTSDGVSIAYYDIGEGQPLVMSPGLVTNVQSEWRTRGRRDWYERLATEFRVIRYDRRGSGLSDRAVRDYSVEGLVRDIEAVVDHVGLEQFALWGVGFSGPPAIACTALHPARVSKLILYAADARGQSILGIRDDTTQYLLERDWELFTETYTRQTYDWPESEQVRAEAVRLRGSVTQEAMQLLFEARRTWDVSEMLPEVKCPTLVLYRPEWATRGDNLMRATASAIKGARLVALEGRDVAPYAGDTDALFNVLKEFLAEGDEALARSTTSLAEGALRTILFTDVEGSTALTQRLGDEGARVVLREHERMTREALAAHGGSEVKTMGDGFMASFGSATKALECAIAMQKAFAERTHDAQAPDLEPLRVRIGLNAGEPIAEADDLFGTAVITAARIAGQANGGEILVSDVVRQLVAGKGFLFSDRGEQALRGFDDPVRVYEVRWKEEDYD